MTKLLPESEPGDGDSRSEMVELCSTFDVVALDNGFVADSCFAASADVAAAAAGGVGDSGIVDGVAGAGGGDGGEGPHPPRSTYQTINTYLEMSKFLIPIHHTCLSSQFFKMVDLPAETLAGTEVLFTPDSEMQKDNLNSTDEKLAPQKLAPNLFGQTS